MFSAICHILDINVNIIKYLRYVVKIFNMIKIRLRELMWERNISAVQIQKETGINAATISRIINRKHSNLSLETIDRLCDVLDCKIQDLPIYERVNK